MSEAQPSQITGQVKNAQGLLYQAVGAIPGTADSWTTQGAELAKEGQDEVHAAQEAQKSEAQAERVEGKVQSAWGALTGNQETLNEGNLKAEKAEWKGAVADGEIPVPSMDRVKGKVESAVGMATGDVDKQREGNVRAEAAEWTKG
ncbi:uncharacterized protein RHOBADRAFT_18849 [Rhodotorula graminis WP1]|uniref:CsbD-like domain-containing protein n=1 Tax=Rhodotorula graminis (strain WP1) TaxID=578459 RepID=A0A0P9EEZ0_RHOGW|nr:uncharacterized protein RHOBADRAFT_18849 [Rhodotorula graminis WP1]KPV71937.1 hypothetical protein RHOBADRAFT_18849 [Rhodotorula graminis WP1]